MAQSAQTDLDDLYGDVILDHCRNPRNSNPVEPADLRADGVNPFCGDEVHLQVALKNGRAARVGVQSVGCSINRASASIMAEALEDKTPAHMSALAQAVRAMMDGKSSTDWVFQGHADLRALEQVREFPVRIKCALLPWTTLEDELTGRQD
ncbi:MAG: SUF system NifU family Fe-S cluster assembly protein [SAR202 cluster bacterium]|nr:SUF system NifU family Fe-S cluster assembly protein [SAR202 cluster bacterium]